MSNTPITDAAIIERRHIHKMGGSVELLELIDADVARDLEIHVAVAREMAEKYRASFHELRNKVFGHANSNVRRERTSDEEAEWLEDKRSEYEADRICGHHWSNI